MPGCAKASPPQPPQNTPTPKLSQVCTGPGTIVTIFVEWDGTTATTRNKTAYVCEGKDSVEWVSCVGEISDNFTWKPGPPFDKPTHPDPSKKNVLKSKPPKAGTAGQGFDYTLDFLPPGGGKAVQIDPRIVVMP
jgi:hypothetical protein